MDIDRELRLGDWVKISQNSIGRVVGIWQPLYPKDSIIVLVTDPDESISLGNYQCSETIVPGRYHIAAGTLELKVSSYHIGRLELTQKPRNRCIVCWNHPDR